ncbi:MAG: DUF2115 family protein [Clostridia bacterium]|nr:DUF2115 family protein [Clostridia bacterium]
MLRAELLRRLRAAIGAEEWTALEEGRLYISGHNRETLLEMRDAPAPPGEVDDALAEALDAALERYLREYMAERPEGWKWIRLSCSYLSFIARRPLHPIRPLGIRRTALPDGGARYECPQRSEAPDAVCRWCVCGRALPPA